MNCNLETTIPDWIIEHPETTGVFNEFNLDISCAGKSLQYVCLQHGLNPAEMLLRVRTVIVEFSSIDADSASP
ncbi:hypothetical protein [Aporhodopirellula aestuarii]|uniref:Uncharacterized protein n=1 Tax=Aporhodopirellula aestuarii TaxID=2950107 RepID=A0ABT0TYX2_9BACT|nr:hypothetical protein [Aporhodopirellula aestuarii]MCM2369686.1 hypothetical protein [Aporhodopirellula aestuarii]